MKQPNWDDVGTWLEVASALLALTVVIFHLIRDSKQRKKTNQITVLVRAAGLAILPQALVFVLATFRPDIVCHIQGLRLFFMLSGLALLYICFQGVTS